ncbi:hypothetical protein DEO72_LG3g2991 [Vigna unguiculata]|uniref:Uncharacterized protein n=1 Tax=Vigna unguiculata TaxID=3917 RepID=A0A4D6LIS1_VIGUN|nr:hypothetical protein DEO72_LG3g2991 [Vigna unguiculata]
MGRGRGKGKKLSVSNEEDSVISGEEERVPKQKRRGRPQKVLKDEFDEEEIEEMEADDSGENVKNAVVSSKETKNLNSTKQGRKRKRNSEEKTEAGEEKNGVRIGSNIDGLTKCNGFRNNGSRRKSKPRRAAEAGVLCKQDYA